jgi:ATP-dependent 26S proteasome regulatory subunit
MCAIREERGQVTNDDFITAFEKINHERRGSHISNENVFI